MIFYFVLYVFLRPRFFLMENVRGMFSKDSANVLLSLTRAIVAMGYQVKQIYSIIKIISSFWVNAF
jgi:site-specific DNA-cytosine methylase